MKNCHDFTICLDNNLEIKLESLFQYQTYLTLLTGWPTKELNQRYINRALILATEKLWNCETPYLIQPIQAALGILKERWTVPENEFEPVSLPRVTCLATFSSSSRAIDSNADYSELHIVWYQNEFALPIDPGVLKQICAIDWPTYATDCYF